MTNTPLNPDALSKAAESLYNENPWQKEVWRNTFWGWEELEEENQDDFRRDAEVTIQAYLAVAQPKLQANSKPKQNLEFVTTLEILRAHQRSFRNGRCSCEEYGRKRSFEEHDEHVAEVLDKHEREAKAEAWDVCSEAWEQAHRLDNIEPWGYLPDNPYKETE